MMTLLVFNLILTMLNICCWYILFVEVKKAKDKPVVRTTLEDLQKALKIQANDDLSAVKKEKGYIN